MEESELYQGTCRIFNDLGLEGRPGDRLFICTRPLTLKRRGVCPANMPFSEGAVIAPGDIDALLETGELIQVGTFNGRAAKFDSKYSFLAQPPKSAKRKKLEDEA